MGAQVMEFRCPRCDAPVRVRYVEVFTRKLRVEVSRAGDVQTDDDVRAGPSCHNPGLRIHLTCEGDNYCPGRSVLSLAEHKGQFVAKLGTDPGEGLEQQRGEA